MAGLVLLFACLHAAHLAIAQVSEDLTRIYFGLSLQKLGLQRCASAGPELSALAAGRGRESSEGRRAQDGLERL